MRLLFPGETPTTVSEREYFSERLENVLRQLKYTDRIERRTTDKQLRLIDTRLRKTLRRYDPEAELTDAFRRGTYNDATATLLLALTLERFNIPYSAHVDHWESYLVVDSPREVAVLRHPGSRPHDLDAELTYRREYLTLVRTALDLELANLSTQQADSVFYRYHYRPGQRLGFRQLTAYSQLRRAEAAYAAMDYGGTRQHLTQALALESRRAFLVLDWASAIQQSSLRRPEVEGYVDELFRLWKENPDNGYLPAALLRHFDDRQRLLLDTGQPNEALALLNRYQSRAPGGQRDWTEQLHLLQTLRLINYYRQLGQEVQALHLAETLLTGAPDNERYRSYVAELTLVGLRRRYLDPGELVTQAERAAIRHPFLREHDRYADIVLRQAALKVRDRFAAGETAAGLEALGAFREKLSEVPNGHDRTLWTLTAFVAASNHYFAAEQYGPARAYIKEALKYDTTNDFLLHQQELLSHY